MYFMDIRLGINVRVCPFKSEMPSSVYHMCRTHQGCIEFLVSHNTKRCVGVVTSCVPYKVAPYDPVCAISVCRWCNP